MNHYNKRKHLKPRARKPEPAQIPFHPKSEPKVISPKSMKPQETAESPKDPHRPARASPDLSRQSWTHMDPLFHSNMHGPARTCLDLLGHARTYLDLHGPTHGMSWNLIEHAGTL
jgi:hypothetical protein